MGRVLTSILDPINIKLQTIPLFDCHYTTYPEEMKDHITTHKNRTGQDNTAQHKTLLYIIYKIYKMRLLHISQANLGLGKTAEPPMPLLPPWTGPSFWIQCFRPFLGSLQILFEARFKFPSRSSEASNCSSTFTICQKSGLLSGATDQQRSIRAFIAAGQSPGITGLRFWTKRSTFFRL